MNNQPQTHAEKNLELTARIHNAAKVLTANSATKKHVKFIIVLWSQEVGNLNKNEINGILTREAYQAAFFRETARCWQRLESLAEYHGVAL